MALKTIERPQKIGIMLTGGGARGSYQAGALLALSEILKSENLLGKNNPLRVWAGVSAGAINTAYCSAGINDLHGSASRLSDIWGSIKPGRVFRTDILSISKNSLRWIRDLTFGPLFKKKLARSLLDTTPLFKLISEGMHFGEIQKQMDLGLIDAVGVSAYNYHDNRTVTFVQSNESVSWQRTRRYSVNGPLRPEHVMASCSIPVLFPAYKVDDVYFGDGSFRNMAQLSPVIQMGAEKILVLGVRGPSEITGTAATGEPGVALLSGMILNALFFDSLIMDIERLRRINDIVKTVTNAKDIVTDKSNYTVVDFKILHPSLDLSSIAASKSVEGFPKTIEFLLAGLGSRKETAELASYILFDTVFTRDLIDLGYKDTIAQKNDILAFIVSS
jgi:NTE family protein